MERGMIDDETVANVIDALLDARAPTASICPSEAARRLDPREWRRLMPQVRAVAAHMAAEGRLLATQKGAQVDPLAAKGPIRLAQPR